MKIHFEKVGWISRVIDKLCQSRLSACSDSLDLKIGEVTFYQTQIKALQDTISKQEAEIRSYNKNGTEVPTIASELKLDDIPTSRDKPSPDSSLTLQQAIELATFVGQRSTQYTKKPCAYFTVANTNSMEWFIDANTVVVVEKVDSATNLDKGDVVIYDGNGSDRQVDGSLVMHRIIGVDEIRKKYLVKGDNNVATDGWIQRKYILWKAFAYIHANKIQEQKGDD